MTLEEAPTGEKPLAVVALQPGLPLHHAVGAVAVAVLALGLADVVDPVLVPHAARRTIVVVVEEPAIK